MGTHIIAYVLLGSDRIYNSFHSRWQYDDDDCPLTLEHVRWEGEGEYGRIRGEEEKNANYEGMLQPSQQHVAPCV